MSNTFERIRFINNLSCIVLHLYADSFSNRVVCCIGQFGSTITGNTWRCVATYYRYEELQQIIYKWSFLTTSLDGGSRRFSEYLYDTVAETEKRGRPFGLSAY